MGWPRRWCGPTSWPHLAPLTIQAHKLALEGLAPPPGADEVFERARSAAWDSADAEEGRTAFLAKRRPDFRGR